MLLWLRPQSHHNRQALSQSIPTDPRGWTPWNENWLTAWPEMKPCCRPDTLITGSGSADPDTEDQVAANTIRPGEPKSQKERRGQEAAA